MAPGVDQKSSFEPFLLTQATAAEESLKGV